MSDERDLQETKPLADDVPVRLDARRLDAQWSRIAARLEDQPRFRWPVFAIVPALVVAVVLVLLVGRWRGTPASTSESALTLGDGSTVAFGAGTALALRDVSATRMALELTAGSVLCDVTHVEGRTFVVRAGGHDVTVLGTRFSVTLAKDGRTLEVRVDRGRVRVSGPSGEHVLGAGQSFSTQVVPDDRVSTQPPAPTASPSIEPTVPPVETIASVTPRATTEPRLPPAESPKELFAKAMEARAKGQSHEAAAALDTLRRRHRTDARAGLAAFELGRLRLDTLNEPAGAAEAFGDAMALAPNGPFREDAEARRVEALERAHDGRCAKAKAAYLERFPTGLHVKTVSARCGN